MFLALAQPVDVVLAKFGNGEEQCVISERQSDSEVGNPIFIRCSSKTASIGLTQKGASVNVTGSCSAIVTLNAVHFPKLVLVDACHKQIKVRDVGTRLARKIAWAKGVSWDRIEYLTYDPVKNGKPCYRITLTYAALNNASNSPYCSLEQRLCVSLGDYGLR
jgi:hypothetical protein